MKKIYFDYNITYADRATHYRALKEKILRYVPKSWCSDDILSRRANIFIIKNVNKIYNLGYDKLFNNKVIDRCYIFAINIGNDIELKLVNEDELTSSVSSVSDNSIKLKYEDSQVKLTTSAGMFVLNKHRSEAMIHLISLLATGAMSSDDFNKLIENINKQKE